MADKKSITVSLDQSLLADYQFFAGSIGVSRSSLIAIAMQWAVPRYKSLLEERGAALPVAEPELVSPPKVEADPADKREVPDEEEDLSWMDGMFMKDDD